MKVKLFCLLTSFAALYSCSNEDEEIEGIYSPEKTALPKVEFVRLTDNASQEAGVFHFEADASEASLKWIVGEGYNLDTTQTVVKLTDGKGTIPICWDKKLEEGNYGPSDVAYKAYVMLTTDNQSKSIPLVWAAEVDSTKLMKTEFQTRAVGVTPRTTELRFVPSTANMNDVAGATMVVIYTGARVVLFDYSKFISAVHHIDMDSLPRYLSNENNDPGTQYVPIDFKWTEDGPAEQAFEVPITAQAEDGFIGRGTLKWDGASSNAPTLEFEPATLPSPLPAAGGKNIANVLIKTNQGTWKAYSNQTWLNIAPQMGVGGSYILLSADPNPNMATRVATVTVDAGKLTKSFTVTQSGAPAATLTITPLAQVIPAEGGTVSSTVTATGAWTVTNNAPSWLTVSPTTGNGNGTISYTAATNTTASVRTANVVVTSGILTQTVSITQNPQASTGIITSAKLSSDGLISEFGGEIIATFEGDYNGIIMVRAKTNGNDNLSRGTGNRQNGVRLTIPLLRQPANRLIDFEYSIDGGNSWDYIATRTQILETFSISPVSPVGEIPAAGGVYSCGTIGTYSKTVTLRARGENTVFDTATGQVPSQLSVRVPAYSGAVKRVVYIEYLLEHTGQWSLLEVKRQAGQ